MRQEWELGSTHYSRGKKKRRKFFVPATDRHMCCHQFRGSHYHRISLSKKQAWLVSMLHNIAWGMGNPAYAPLVLLTSLEAQIHQIWTHFHHFFSENHTFLAFADISCILLISSCSKSYTQKVNWTMYSSEDRIQLQYWHAMSTPYIVFSDLSHLHIKPKTLLIFMVVALNHCSVLRGPSIIVHFGYN